VYFYVEGDIADNVSASKRSASKRKPSAGVRSKKVSAEVWS